ncbi:hypothetical protein BDV38DRAFT_262161 [Aspergillus pseudotamarii]|uniref:Ankyrin repeat-containing domain protein n=1 Tax=Aspergillus pseudotamarii TaxID=132259 RepID=A0A5N6SG77_ASPPS|nr:uncharacterized protein BDV38DRAFT_262161 [Aspergillus pseudotamarii]KAE8132104.1 hypothetical protein BDV38DRAFT_262161 [Aspergillus pseudotamarii]
MRLHLATLRRHTKIIDLLGKCGIPYTKKKRTDIPHIIRTHDDKRQKPLILASQMGHINCARQFFESRVDISIKDATG